LIVENFRSPLCVIVFRAQLLLDVFEVTRRPVLSALPWPSDQRHRHAFAATELVQTCPWCLADERMNHQSGEPDRRDGRKDSPLFPTWRPN